ncbi:MAG TPA: hypothetical protein VIV60_07055 [Polyangiaceae bacterium]
MSSSVALCARRLAHKGVAFANLGRYLSNQGVLFGATLLGSGSDPSPLGRVLMSVYNRRRIFSNRPDSREGLKQALARSLQEYSVTLRGCVALFVAQGKRETARETHV